MTTASELPLQKILMDGIQNLLFVIRVGANSELYYEFLNKAAMEATGLTDRVIGIQIKDLYHGDKASFLYDKYNSVVETKQVVIYNDSYVSPLGELVYSQTTLTPIFDEQNSICTHVVAMVKDITNERVAYIQNKETTKKLRENEQHFRIIAEHAHDLITLLDNRGRFIYASPSYRKTLDFDNEDYIGELFLETVHLDNRSDVEEKLHISVKENKSCKMQFQQKHKTKGWIWQELTGTPVYDDQKTFSHMVIVSRDITLQKRYEKNLEYYALHDILTGLPNRLQFNQRLKEAIQSYQLNRDGLAVLMVDIDNFKQINDTMGHDIGDLVISEFGKRLNSCLRSNDLAARLGGDEFAIVLPGIKCKYDAIGVAHRIKDIIREPWNIRDETIHVTTSIGISLATEKEELNEFSILKTADIALYEAKKSGKDNFRIKESTA